MRAARPRDRGEETTDPIMERWDRLKLIVIKGADEGKQFELVDPEPGRGRASIGSNSGIGDNFHIGGRNLGRGNRGANRDRTHQKRREGRDQMALKLRARHVHSPFFECRGGCPSIRALSFTRAVPIADFREK